MYLCPSCGILETTSLCWLGALPLVSLPSPKVSVSPLKAAPSSWESHGPARSPTQWPSGLTPSPQGAPPRQPEGRVLFPRSCPFLGPQRAFLKFMLPPQQEDGREARWPFTRLWLECGELLLLQIMSGLRMKNTLTVRVVLGSGDARRSDCPSLSVVSYGPFCLGGFPPTTAGGGHLLHPPDQGLGHHCPKPGHREH